MSYMIFADFFFEGLMSAPMISRAQFRRGAFSRWYMAYAITMLHTESAIYSTLIMTVIYTTFRICRYKQFHMMPHLFYRTPLVGLSLPTIFRSYIFAMLIPKKRHDSSFWRHTKQKKYSCDQGRVASPWWAVSHPNSAIFTIGLGTGNTPNSLRNACEAREIMSAEAALTLVKIFDDGSTPLSFDLLCFTEQSTWWVMRWSPLLSSES